MQCDQAGAGTGEIRNLQEWSDCYVANALGAWLQAHFCYA
ncbi:hypothetical protein RR42_s1743 [Cupriavidus basilensis]|uniref:Uncharacterized protein n=1 Tax=Cupriavidus basilensis TaxID=68895 RepID=A0A0C4YRR8_9BURK|nr:hypothetical protein RR42_s1743 [Cupriavidus basilensis]